MKTELKAKYIQHLINKKKNSDEGFTLIELLVVIIIIGILSAIALPSFLNQANKAKQSEARTYVGSMNRGQQAFYLERSTFTPSLDATGVGIASQTTNYTYQVDGGGANTSIVTNEGVSRAAAIRSYGGVVWLATIAATSEATTEAILCEADAPGTTDPTASAAAATCPGGGFNQIN
ncbi:MAG: prepilin-type N-terminal cleavage/methylation domain-containing protein [Cyanothece sp. SIO2G6]|nr:prepilin-type N-terminal cleavage/methylation domain-containing protein [Cyanothece sp. SIO2G6]